MADLYAADNRGIYIPQYFAQTINRDLVHGVPEEDWKILESGPDNEYYWEAWDGVLFNAKIKASNAPEGFLYQDGDLWIIWGEDDPDYKNFIQGE